MITTMYAYGKVFQFQEMMSSSGCTQSQPQSQPQSQTQSQQSQPQTQSPSPTTQSLDHANDGVH